MEAISPRNSSSANSNSKPIYFLSSKSSSKQKTKSPPTPPLRSNDLKVTLNPGYDIATLNSGAISVVKTPSPDQDLFQINSQIRKAVELTGGQTMFPGMARLQDRVAHRSYDNHPSPVMPLKEKEMKFRRDDASTSSVGNSTSSIATLSRQQSVSAAGGPGGYSKQPPPVNNLSREMLQQQQQQQEPFEPVSS